MMMDEIHELKIFALVVSGKPLTQQVNDMLLLNAIDMWDCHNHKQPIKSRNYDGVIESDLEVVEHFGAPVVQFKAMVSTTKFGATAVKYLVKIDDLDGIEGVEWGRLQLSANMPPLPPGFMPELEEDDG
jgi:hypothetical protein